MPSTTQVLIAGAGPTGLAAALVLRRNGIDVRIIEKQASTNPGSRGSGLRPRTLELFHQLEAKDIIEKSSQVIPIRAYKPGTLEVAKDLWMETVNEATPQIPYPSVQLMGQGMTERLLRGHLAECGCNVEFATELRSFEQNGDGVIAHIARIEGDKEVTDTIHAQYLIGTDGARSVVRKQLGLAFLGETREETRMLTGDVRFTAEGLDRHHWHRFGDMNSKMVMLRPCPSIGTENDGFQVMLGGPEIDLNPLFANKQALCDKIAELVPAKFDFKEVIWYGEFRPNIRMVDKFSVGRVFVAGDAAHCHSPTGGQGLNSSVQDSVNLGWKLSYVLKGLSPPSLLETYSEERLPVIAEMLNLTTGVLNQSAIGTDASFVRPSRLLMLGVNHRTSSIVLEELSPALAAVPAYGDSNVEGVLAAGDRAPDAPGLVDAKGGEHRFFDVFRTTYHTVLVFAPNVEAATHIINAIDGKYAGVVRAVVVLPGSAFLDKDEKASSVLTLCDAHRHAYTGYRAHEGETRAVVVRPDGFIGASVRTAEGVERYFAKIFVSA
ncbi:hypothetical protein CONPUDRAFT_120706 [Coniophora puteana RWD-64-598 SS2]|uniref:FAD-binding domain-containing protein n=1 Tax=Coniophora puteana (strain RWD-64-598) TaxID=741705 RepID=A0A5M3MTX4_CONPW|nr:uncharacterized protein CONPUDRAFT_120706 [Coniophora puteana RWD-64-598 SS2]EIW82608.1 hypothetical protein CONPUDRAFT_120706 [Coniophora puteana RWD-64-598 SS2]